MKSLVIEWQRLLDEQKKTCPRCGSTEQEVEKAVKKLNSLLASNDISVSLTKKSSGAPSGRSRRLPQTTRPPGTAYSRR